MARDQKCEQGGDRRVPFGLREGRLLGSMEVARGLACGCQCPGCGGALVARHGRGGRRPHFAHLGGYGEVACFESAVHQAAKQALVEATHFWLPKWEGAEEMPNPPELRDDGGVLHRGRKVDRPGRMSGVGGGRAEVDLGDFRPDVVVRDTDGELLVEVSVSHPVGADKAALVRQRDLRMVEIDLSDCPVGLLATPSEFRRWVCESAPRQWIWEPAAARQWAENARVLAAELQQLSLSGDRDARGQLAPSTTPMDWDAFRRLFEEREITPINRPPFIDDPMVGAWIWLEGKGAAEITARLTRMGGVYRVRLENGIERIVYLGRD